MKESDSRIILEGHIDILIEQALKFEFTRRNNQEDYEALIFGTLLTLEMGASKLKAKVYSQLVTNQVFGHYQANEPPLTWFLQKVRNLSSRLSSFKLGNVPREQNSREDLMSKLATSNTVGFNIIVIQETLTSLNI